MNQGKYVFTQISSFLPQRVFDRLVAKHKGNYKIRHFSCWNQLLCMMFGQLSNRESLSDLVLAINAHSGKLYHLALGKGVSKANLSRSNEQRPFMIYQEFAYYLIEEAGKLYSSETENPFSFSSPVYAFDSTTIDLCLSMFCWATFRRAKGAVKLHTLFDVLTSIPVFVHVSAGSVHDINAMDMIAYEQGSFYIFDRGYVDFKRLFVIHQSKSFFVIRSKTKLKFERKYSSPINRSAGIRCDQTGVLTGFISFQGYPEMFRKIKFFDEEQNRMFIFITNNVELKAEEIASIYKLR